MGVETKRVALGGMMAALAVCVMCIGGIIPMATYVSPVICMFILRFVTMSCGKRLAWAWYAATAFLSVLLCADKESAAVFLFLGYYPLLKTWFDRQPLKWVLKLGFFNAVTAALYAFLIFLLGMDELSAEFRDSGTIVLIITVVLANVVFVFTDRLLSMRLRVR